MYRELLSNPHIGSYSAFLVLALFAGYLIARWRAVRLGIKGTHIDNVTLLIAVLSLLGARVFSWWFYFPPGSSFWHALTSSGGGMVFYGGLIFGVATLIVYARFARLSLGNLTDAFAPGVALGLALGRVGCFMAGCCWGDLCVHPRELANLPSSEHIWQVRTVPAISGAGFPLAVQFPPEAAAFRQHSKLNLLAAGATRSRPVHPVQLYEAVLALGLCVGLHRGFHRRQWPGQVACALAAGYSGIRFVTEFLRGDNSPIYFGFTLSQVISLFIAAVAIGLLVSRKATPAVGRLQTVRIH